MVVYLLTKAILAFRVSLPLKAFVLFVYVTCHLIMVALTRACTQYKYIYIDELSPGRDELSPERHLKKHVLQKYLLMKIRELCRVRSGMS